MKKPTAILAAAVLTATLTATGVALAHGTGDQNSTAPGTPEMGQGMMGQGMMGKDTMPLNKTAAPGKIMVGGMGYGMMGGGQRHGMMMGHASPHYQGQAVDRNLSADDVRKILEGHFAWMGHKRLQVGDIKKQDNGTLLADINTVDGSLVMRMEVDPKTGARRHVNE